MTTNKFTPPLHDDFQFVNVSRLMTPKKSIASRKQGFGEIYYPYQTKQAQNQAHRCIDCGNPYCEWKCPVHNYIPNWLKLVNEGKIIEAAELCHQTNTLPEVCGRICPQDRLCEDACTLNEHFGAVTIGAIEKYITEEAFNRGWRPHLSKVINKNKRVAIIGAGPAGLACADVLARKGIASVVFDRYSEIGGLLTFGIPEFKLEKSVMKRRHEIFTDMGIEFCLNTDIGKDITIDTLINKYDAVFMGMGTDEAVQGNIQKQDNINGLYQALPYLIGNICHIHSILNPPAAYISLKGKQVAVLGGGDTAMDCTRTAIRQGAKKVTCIYRRNEKAMPGSRTEVNNAREEGVEFLFNRQPIAITGNTNVTGITCVKTSSDVNNNSNRPHYSIVARSEKSIETDAVIIAFGYRPQSINWLTNANIDTDNNGLTIVGSKNINSQNKLPYQTTNPKVFAGGDMIRGADLVVTAIADGRQAAESIITFINE